MNPTREELTTAIQTLNSAVPRFRAASQKDSINIETRNRATMYKNAALCTITGLGELLDATPAPAPRADWSGHDRAKVGTLPQASPSLRDAVREIHNALYPEHPINPTHALAKDIAAMGEKVCEDCATSCPGEAIPSMPASAEREAPNAP